MGCDYCVYYPEGKCDHPEFNISWIMDDEPCSMF